jgi:hypothetical protein
MQLVYFVERFLSLMVWGLNLNWPHRRWIAINKFTEGAERPPGQWRHLRAGIGDGTLLSYNWMNKREAPLTPQTQFANYCSQRYSHNLPPFYCNLILSPPSCTANAGKLRSAHETSVNVLESKILASKRTIYVTFEANDITRYKKIKYITIYTQIIDEKVKLVMWYLKSILQASCYFLPTKCTYSSQHPLPKQPQSLFFR